VADFGFGEPALEGRVELLLHVEVGDAGRGGKASSSEMSSIGEPNDGSREGLGFSSAIGGESGARVPGEDSPDSTRLRMVPVGEGRNTNCLPTCGTGISMRRLEDKSEMVRARKPSRLSESRTAGGVEAGEGR
jgi:hypothetical protein